MNHAVIPSANRRNARKMRKAMTDAELMLWNEVRAHRLMGLAFRRQMPIAGYIVDFACPSRRLVVEVDGSQHGESARDAVRDRTLSNLGWTVLRFWNDGHPPRHRQCLPPHRHNGRSCRAARGS